MAKVIRPMFSLKASGSLKKTIYFSCGRIVRSFHAEPEEGSMDYDNLPQVILFKQAAYIWKHNLSDEVKNSWRRAYLVSFGSIKCILPDIEMMLGLWMYYSPQNSILIPPMIILTYIAAQAYAFWVNGYALFQEMYILHKGPNWSTYPLPPEGVYYLPEKKRHN